MDFFTNAWHFINELARAIPPGAVEALVAAIIASPLAQTIKQFYHGQKVWVKHLIAGFASALVVAAHYLSTTPTDNPSIMVMQTFIVYAVTQPVYFAFIAPLTKGLTNFFSKVDSQATDITSATIPATGLPTDALEKTIVTTEDFLP